MHFLIIKHVTRLLLSIILMTLDARPQSRHHRRSIRAHRHYHRLRLRPPESMRILDLPGKYKIEKGDSPQQHTIPVRDPQSSKYHSEEQYDSYDDTS